MNLSLESKRGQTSWVTDKIPVIIIIVVFIILILFVLKEKASFILNP